MQDGKFVRRERDQHEIMGYDDINQLFWYPERISCIVLSDKVNLLVSSDDNGIDHPWPRHACLVDVPPAQRFMKFDQIDWNRVFFKTYEKRSGAHPLVNFNRSGSFMSLSSGST